MSFSCPGVLLWEAKDERILCGLGPPIDDTLGEMEDLTSLSISNHRDQDSPRSIRIQMDVRAFAKTRGRSADICLLACECEPVCQVEVLIGPECRFPDVCGAETKL